MKVTIPFQRINLNPFRVLSEDEEDKKEDGLRFRALTRGQSEVLRLMEENPGITVPEIAKRTGLSFPGIYKIIRKSKEERLLMRLGSRKSGSWKVMDRHSA